MHQHKQGTNEDKHLGVKENASHLLFEYELKLYEIFHNTLRCVIDNIFVVEQVALFLGLVNGSLEVSKQDRLAYHWYNHICAFDGCRLIRGNVFTLEE